MKRKQIILPSNICSCRCMKIPPVSSREAINILRYKLSSFYPGSVEDLLVDSLKKSDFSIVFYIDSFKMNKLRRQNPDGDFYSSYHIFANRPIREKSYIILDDRIEVFTPGEDEQFELRSIPRDADSESDLVDKGYIPIRDISIKGNNKLFSRKKTVNYRLQIVSLLFLLVFVPQFSVYIQYKYDELYLQTIENQLNELVIENSRKEISEKNYRDLKLEYETLLNHKPISLYGFFSELSSLLGSNTEIDSLVLKNTSFQLNGKGYNPLNKMEGFQNSKIFHSVIPYQVQAMDGTTKEKFSLTGFYYYE